MKTVSGKISFFALALLAIIAILGLRALTTASAQPTDPNKKWKFSKAIGGPGKDEYAELNPGQQRKFDNALIKLKDNGGDYHIKFLCKAGGKPEEPYDPKHHPVCSIKTDKVTTSEVASSTTTDAAAANDPNAVNHLYSDYQADIDAVLACFKQ